MSLAPIGVSAYARPEHLRQTIRALQNNALAGQSELYVFSDGPKAGAEEKVRAVRQYLKSVDGFKKVEVLERPENNRVYNNRQGIRTLLDEYGKIIFLEEDVVTAPSFLDYMNRALDFYEDDPRVFSIAGYCPPIDIPEDYPYDLFFHPRFNPWGCGLWKDRYDRISMNIPAQTMRAIFLHPGNLHRFSRGGFDMLPLALKNYYGFADGLDVKVFTQQFMMGTLTAYPVMHLVDNSGVDGSGMHPKKKPRFRVALSNEGTRKYRFPPKVEADQEIARRMYRFRSGSIGNRARIVLSMMWILGRKGLRLPDAFASRLETRLEGLLNR